MTLEAGDCVKLELAMINEPLHAMFSISRQ